MLKTVTSLLTAACVFAHAVLGCCVHHAHGDEACGDYVAECHEHEAHDSHSHDGHDHASDKGESTHADDCSCEECVHGDSLLPSVSDGPHDSGHHPQSSCEGESCHWSSTSAPINPLLSFDWHFASTFRCCDLSSALTAWERGCLNRRRIAPDKLSSALRVHALDQVWQL